MGLPRWLTVGSIISVLAYWGARQEYHVARAAHERAVVQSSTGPLIAGRLVTVSEVISILDQSPGVQPQSGPTVIVVSSDSCRACASQSALWQELVHSTMPHHKVILASVDGGMEYLAGALSVLRERKMTYMLAQITDLAAFSAITGVTATPATLLLDRSQRIRLVASPLLAEDIVIVRQYLLQESYSSIRFSSEVSARRLGKRVEW